MSDIVFWSATHLASAIRAKEVSALDVIEAHLARIAEVSPALPHGVTKQPDFPPSGMTAYTKSYSMAGWPSVVVRAGTSLEGMPLGIQIVAGPWQEHLALVVAQAIERALGGWRKSPL